MKKFILLSFACFLSFSSESVGMEKKDEPMGHTAQRVFEYVFEEETHNKDDGFLVPTLTSQEIKKNRPFELYIQTGDWGEDSFKYDHLGDLLAKLNKENISPLSYTRGKAFYFEETSSRTPKEQQQTLTQEMIDERFSHQGSNDDQENLFPSQDQPSDLFSRKSKNLKSTRGETFYIISTSKRGPTKGNDNLRIFGK